MASSQTNKDDLKHFIENTSEKIIKEGMIPKDAGGISPVYMENMYAQGYRLYNTGKYEEAVHIFRMLIMMNAMEPKYILGLAAAFHMLKEYDTAIQTYMMVGALDPTNPIPHYHSADCFIKMNDPISAMVCLELAISTAGDRPEYAKMRERALLTLESVKKQASSGKEGGAS